MALNCKRGVLHQSVANIWCQSQCFSALAVFAQLVSISFSAPAERMGLAEQQLQTFV